MSLAVSETTEMTGGRVFAVENLNELPDIASKIGMSCETNMSWDIGQA